jgi:hypothetical protein
LVGQDNRDPLILRDPQQPMTIVGVDLDELGRVKTAGRVRGNVCYNCVQT